jgi:hypothetical protein
LVFISPWCESYLATTARDFAELPSHPRDRVTDVPTVLIADAQGKLIRRMVPDDAESLRKAIE